MKNILWAVVSYKFLVESIRAVGVCSVLALILLSASNAAALVKFDFEQKYFSEPGEVVMDHSIVKKDGVYHIFYLRGNPAVNIGHATTTDFVNWTIEPPVLQPGTWDVKLWAPFVMRAPGYGWYMFYTGVNQKYAQQIGLACSPNLTDWYKIPFPMYRPDTTWAFWDETKFSPGRDPHVLEYDGKYYLFATALTRDIYGAVACAESNDMLQWTDIGPMYVHNSWHVLESVFVKYRNNKFHMFFTEEQVYGTSHMCSDALFSGWDITTRYIIDQGHAPNIFELDDGREIFSRHAVYNDGLGYTRYVLRFDTLTWVGNYPAPYKPWGLAKDWTLVWGNAFAYQPVYLNNPKVRGEDVDDTFEGDCWLGTYERYTGPLGFGFPGGFQGDSRTGVIRSKPFTITGYSMNLLVGGLEDIVLCYVALVDAGSGQVIYKETGKNTDEMDRRYWDLKPYRNKQAYVEIADLASGTFGHINCDDINESWNEVGTGGDTGGTPGKKDSGISDNMSAADNAKTLALYQNKPNPFNPVTTLSYSIPRAGRVALRIYDVGGRLVRELVNGTKAEGKHEVVWDGHGGDGMRAVSGIYFYQLSFDGRIVETRKMILLK